MATGMFPALPPVAPDGIPLGAPLDVPVPLLAAVVGQAAVWALALEASLAEPLDELSPPDEQAARLSHTATVAATAAVPFHGPVRELLHEPGRDVPAFRACRRVIPLFSSMSVLLADTKS
ncbi:hypothetical protein ACWDR3_22805 [Streptomyces sp. NPDC001002]